MSNKTRRSTRLAKTMDLKEIRMSITDSHCEMMSNKSQSTIDSQCAMLSKKRPIEQIYLTSPTQIKEETNNNYVSDEDLSNLEANNNYQKLNECEDNISNKGFQYEWDVSSKKTGGMSTCKYQCKICRESFICRYELNKHTKLHEDKVYECRLCTFSTDITEKLRQHILELHVSNNNNEGNYSKVDMYDELEQVMERKIPRKVMMEDGVTLGRKRKMKYACGQCSRIYNNKLALERHVRCHTLEKPFNCDMCDFKCSYKENVMRHMTSVHLIIQSKLSRPKNTKKRDDSDLSDSDEEVIVGGKKKRKLTRKFKCAVCGTESSHKADLIKHIKEKHPNAHIESMEGNNGKKVHLITTASKPTKPSKKLTVSCEVCATVFHDKWKYNVHMRTHTGVKPFSCSECSFMATTKMTVRDHVHRRHVDVAHPKIYLRTVGIDGAVEEVALAVPWREFKCEFCGEDLKDNYSLKVHKNKKHEKALPFMCLQCKHKELTKANMIMHCKKEHSKVTNLDTMIIKNGKPVKIGSIQLPTCNVCKKVFSYKSQLNNHLRFHTGEKLFQCIHCPFQSNRKSFFTAHMEKEHIVEDEEQEE